MELIVFYTFKCHHGDEMGLKQYAGILLIEFCADLIYNMDTGKAAVCEPDHCQYGLSRGKDGEARAVGMSRFISNISGFISSRTAMELK